MRLVCNLKYKTSDPIKIHNQKAKPITSVVRLKLLSSKARESSDLPRIGLLTY